MSIAIEHVSIGGDNDGRVVIGSHQLARLLETGTNWNRIRLGMRISVNDSGSNIEFTPRLYIGLLSNPSVVSDALVNGPLNGNDTSHFVGYITQTATWTRSTSPTKYLSSTNNMYGKKVGGTITTAAGASFNQYFSANPSAVRLAQLIEIEKGSPNYSIRIVAPSGTTHNDVTYATLVSAMELSSIENADLVLDGTGTTYTGGSVTASLAVDETTDGPLNAVCFAWDRTAPLFKFSEFLYAIYS